jgi:hypothetical protein
MGSPLVSCARATRGLGRPSLDARNGRPIRPPSRREGQQARKEGIGSYQTILLARRGRTIKMWSLDARSKEQAIQPSLGPLLRFEIQGVALAA